MRLDEIETPDRSPGLNFLYAHWGYEFELRPRRVLIERASRLARDFDLIVGHHSHCPQTFCRAPRGIVAYSLGNSGVYHSRRLLHYGLALKITWSRDALGRPSLTRSSWRWIRTDLSDPSVTQLELIDDCPWFRTPSPVKLPP